MGWLPPCNCYCHVSTPKSLKAFDKSSGALIWEHWLDNVMLASDGSSIYGYAYEEDASPAAKACTIVPLSGVGTPALLGIAPTSTVRYKKHVRRIDSSGAITGDSAFYWYTGNNGYTDSAIDLPNPTIGQGMWMPNIYGASASGGLLNTTGDFTLGTNLAERLISWDDNNSTTIRRYTFVGAAIRDLATPPSGGAKINFIAAADGTRAEQALLLGSTIGMTASAMATALLALPHIASATGTGGPYPLNNIELTITWKQSATHFKSIQRQTGTSRGVMTWVRDWNTAAITATLAQPATAVSKASQWQFDASDNIIGIGTNPAASVGAPAEVGIAVEKFTLSGAAYSQAWRTRPTSNRPPIWGPASGTETQVFYARPAIRAGKLIVGHYPARGDDQAVGQHSEWHELNPSTGALLSNGTANNRLVGRPFFASDTQLVVAGWDSFISGDPVDGVAAGYFQCDRGAPNNMSLMTGLSGVSATYFGPYGTWPGGANDSASGVCDADTTAMYSSSFRPGSPVSSNGWTNDQQTTLMTDQRILTILTRETIGGVSRVLPDGYFGLANYYRIRHFLASPINHHWNATGMEWRVAFFSSDNILPSSFAGPFTAWLPVSATVADVQAALDAILGVNSFGPNAFVEGPLYPATAAEKCPVMIWQRGLEFVFPAENPAFPPTVPPVPYGLNDRAVVRYCRIQVRSAVANQHRIPSWNVSRMDWSTGNVIWDVPFGSAVVGGGSVLAYSGVLLGSNYVVSGPRVNGVL